MHENYVIATSWQRSGIPVLAKQLATTRPLRGAVRYMKQVSIFLKEGMSGKEQAFLFHKALPMEADHHGSQWAPVNRPILLQPYQVDTTYEFRADFENAAAPMSTLPMDHPASNEPMNSAADASRRLDEPRSTSSRRSPKANSAFDVLGIAPPKSSTAVTRRCGKPKQPLVILVEIDGGCDFFRAFRYSLVLNALIDETEDRPVFLVLAVLQVHLVLLELLRFFIIALVWPSLIREAPTTWAIISGRSRALSIAATWSNRINVATSFKVGLQLFTSFPAIELAMTPLWPLHRRHGDVTKAATSNRKDLQAMLQLPRAGGPDKKVNSVMARGGQTATTGITSLANGSLRTLCSLRPAFLFGFWAARRQLLRSRCLAFRRFVSLLFVQASEFMDDKGSGDSGYGAWGKVLFWDGSPLTWRAFKREMQWWLSSLDAEATKKYNLAARWLLRQSGTVRQRGEEFSPEDLQCQKGESYTDPDSGELVEITPEDPFFGINRLMDALEKMNGQSTLDKRGELRAQFYLHMCRKPGERVADYSSRFRTSISDLRSEGVKLPDAELGWFYKEKLGLDALRKQLLETALGGTEDYVTIEADVCCSFFVFFGAALNFHEQRRTLYKAQEEPEEIPELFADEPAGEASAEALVSIREARVKLAEIRKDRGFKGPGFGSGAPAKGRGRGSASIQAKKKDGKHVCFDCGLPGHWAGDEGCTKPGQGLGRAKARPAKSVEIAEVVAENEVIQTEAGDGDPGEVMMISGETGRTLQQAFEMSVVCAEVNVAANTANVADKAVVGALDSACNRTCAGDAWIQEYISLLADAPAQVLIQTADAKDVFDKGTATRALLAPRNRLPLRWLGFVRCFDVPTPCYVGRRGIWSIEYSPTFVKQVSKGKRAVVPKVAEGPRLAPPRDHGRQRELAWRVLELKNRYLEEANQHSLLPLPAPVLVTFFSRDG
ncbi:agaA [Symbiodinium necroappetens]|uniref:AgaA protein n=1 Tax=Symbiodinium necroappetens TaxID=1628268 RepID=A0A812VGD9_9DINO|nr:agaA [Symbiodinium necroappetens]